MNMKSVRILVIAGLIILCLFGIATKIYYTQKINETQKIIEEKMQQKALLEQRIEEVQKMLDGEESKNSSLSEDNKSLNEKITELGKKIDELMIEDVVVFDAAVVADEIKEIGELATQSYCYTNVASIDAGKNFKIVGWTVPFSKKTAVVSMDGTIKAGIDVDLIKITCNEPSKTITIKIPKARILSNELDEDSLCIYDESAGLFNPITLDDSSSIRIQIKQKAEDRAIENGLLTQAKERAGEIIKYLIESIPGIKENYKIEFK